MNFKEALIAHLQGEKVEVFTPFPAYDKHQDGQYKWRGFGEVYSSFEVGDADGYSARCGCEFRLAPRAIIVNGVEVPAPEKAELKDGTKYFIPSMSKESVYRVYVWDGGEFDKQMLDRDLVYLTPSEAIARAKAMLLTQSN